jgi:hypothetical protein
MRRTGNTVPVIPDSQFGAMADAQPQRPSTVAIYFERFVRVDAGREQQPAQHQN